MYVKTCVIAHRMNKSAYDALDFRICNKWVSV